MSDWQISIPHRSRDESLVDVASDCRHLEGDQGAVMREIVFGASIGGMRTAGDLLDHLAALEPAARRQLLDQARVESGLPPTADVEAIERAAAATKAGSVVAARYAGLTICHGKTSAGLRCNAIPMTDYGVPFQANVVAWHCAEHIDQARPGDMGPRPAPWKYSASGAIVENDPAEEAREAAAAESRRAQQESESADRAVAAAATREYEQARDAAHNLELPRHLRGLVA